VTKAKRAWRKANAYVRSGQHDKAIYWLSRTVAILDGERPARSRKYDTSVVGYVVAAAVVVSVWITTR
jgi:hypothetical protein